MGSSAFSAASAFLSFWNRYRPRDTRMAVLKQKTLVAKRKPMCENLRERSAVAFSVRPLVPHARNMVARLETGDSRGNASSD